MQRLLHCCMIFLPRQDNCNARLCTISACRLRLLLGAIQPSGWQPSGLKHLQEDLQLLHDGMPVLHPMHQVAESAVSPKPATASLKGALGWLAAKTAGTSTPVSYISCRPGAALPAQYSVLHLGVNLEGNGSESGAGSESETGPQLHAVECTEYLRSRKSTVADRAVRSFVLHPGSLQQQQQQTQAAASCSQTGPGLLLGPLVRMSLQAASAAWNALHVLGRVPLPVQLPLVGQLCGAYERAVVVQAGLCSVLRMLYLLSENCCQPVKF